MRNWGSFPRENNHIIYDVTLDKPRQIGAATIVLAKGLYDFRRSLLDESQKDAILTIIEQMRAFVVGNTSSSKAKFDSAYRYFLTEMAGGVDSNIRDSINFCSIIVNDSVNHKYIDDLIDYLSETVDYNPGKALEYLEA